MPTMSNDDGQLDTSTPWPFIIWNRDIEIGIRSIDAGHRILCRDYNTFATEVARGASIVAIPYAIATLRTYISHYIKHEETFLREIGYDRFDQHIDDHEEIADRLLRITSSPVVLDSTATALMRLFEYILIDHLAGNTDIANFISDTNQRCSNRAPAPDAPGPRPARGGGPEARDSAPSNPFHNPVTCRLSKRYRMSLPCLVTISNGRSVEGIVEDLSQDGARLSGITGLFREMTGVLKLAAPELPELPDLPFTVVSATACQSSVRFDLTAQMQSLMAGKFRSRAFWTAVLGPDSTYLDGGDVDAAAHGDEPRDAFSDGAGANVSVMMEVGG